MEEVYSSQSAFQEFEKPAIHRRQLLPWWIKFFSWIFMLFGVLALVCLICGFFGVDANLSFYGFETNNPLSLTGLLIVFVALFKGFTAFSLWFEKNNAILLGKIDAILGVALCVISMVVLPFVQEGFTFSIRLEIIFLLLFLVRLDKIQKDWELRL